MLALLIQEVATLATAQDNLARKHIFIPATEPEAVILRVAAYCRVSTDSEDQLNSFAAQQTYYNEYIRKHEGWQMADIYADEGITGTSAAKRDDFQRMLADCRKGRIDKVLVKSISRFARNTKECLEVIRELKTLGISVFFEEHKIDTRMVSSEMLTAVLASCAQAESESISQNMKWGIRARMEKGTYTAPSVPFGYRWGKEGLEIQMEEAVYIRYIFTEYLTGRNTEDIALELRSRSEKESILKARKWSYQSIVHILKNEKYVGDCLNQKTYMTEEFPRRCLRNRGEHAQYYVSNAHSAIIDRDTFTAVQALLQERARRHVKHTMQTSPVASRIVCGNCGANFRRKQTSGKYVYACRTRLADIHACDMLQIREDAIKDAFLRLYYNLRTNQQILTYMVKNLHTIRSRQMLWGADVIQINKETSNIISQSHKLTVMNKNGNVDPDIFIAKRNQLAEQLRQALRQKERLQHQEDDGIIEATEQLLDVINAGPAMLESFDEELFCELIDKVIIQSDTKIRFRLKNGLELPEMIERTVR